MCSCPALHLCLYVERKGVLARSHPAHSSLSGLHWAWVGWQPRVQALRTSARIHCLSRQESALWQKTSRPKSRTTRLLLLTAASPTRTRPGTAGRTTWVSRTWGGRGQCWPSPDPTPHITYLLPPYSLFSFILNVLLHGAHAPITTCVQDLT